ncbi:hypothetical protein CL652_02425 [bacterium]|nr:hypothetical protein [bacterium]|tara:strand:+ start:11557 stop:11841 length:285 start_codon:yes stop_codon:yes gene_type:complete
MTDVDVTKLAKLSRIAVSDEEMKDLEKEVPEILAFVEQIAEAGGEVAKETGEHYNILREDTEPHESSAYTNEMLEAMPDAKNGYLKVRKIISQD